MSSLTGNDYVQFESNVGVGISMNKLVFSLTENEDNDIPLQDRLSNIMFQIIAWKLNGIYQIECYTAMEWCWENRGLLMHNRSLTDQ